MPGRPTTLRTAVAACATLLALLPACDRAPAPLSVEDTPLLNAHAAPGASSTLNRQLAQLRAATARFHDIAAAEAAGYVRLTGCMSEPGSGAQGYHYVKPALVDGQVDLLTPELLMYEPMPGGTLRLVGAEYIVPLGEWKGETPPSLLGEHFHVNEAFGIYALHVWPWLHNPSGLFADWNPKVSCAHAPQD